jgi:hypothetical protein
MYQVAMEETGIQSLLKLLFIWLELNNVRRILTSLTYLIKNISIIFYAHGSVHRESALECSNKMTLFVQYFIPCKQLYMFRVKHSPIIRSSNKL